MIASFLLKVRYQNDLKNTKRTTNTRRIRADLEIGAERERCPVPRPGIMIAGGRVTGTPVAIRLL